jgi:glycosyltransferase involved in cell wall biosynthesis
MHVVILSDLFPPHGGGAEISASIESSSLASHGVKVSVLTALFGKDLPVERVSPNLTIFRIPFLSQRINKFYPFATYLKNRFAVIDTLKIIDYIKKIDPDLVHIQNSEADIKLLLEKLNCKIVISVRDNWPICPNRQAFNGTNVCLHCDVKGMLRCTVNQGLLSPLLYTSKPVLSFTQSIYYLSAILPHIFFNSKIKSQKNCLVSKRIKIVAISQYVKSMLLRNYNISESNISVAYPPLPGYQCNAETAKSKTTFIFIGKLDFSKGIINLLEAFYLSLKKNKNIQLLIFGDGPLRDSIKRIINSRGLESNVVYKGSFKHKDLQEIMKNGQIVIVPSLWPEPFGRVCAEAMLCGKTVVVNPVGGLSEQINNGVNGFYANCYDVKSLSQAIDELANFSCSDLQAIGSEARAFASIQFSSRNNTASILDVYAKS